MSNEFSWGGSSGIKQYKYVDETPYTTTKTFLINTDANANKLIIEAIIRSNTNPRLEANPGSTNIGVRAKNKSNQWVDLGTKYNLNSDYMIQDTIIYNYNLEYDLPQDTYNQIEITISKSTNNKYNGNIFNAIIWCFLG